MIPISRSLHSVHDKMLALKKERKFVGRQRRECQSEEESCWVTQSELMLSANGETVDSPTEKQSPRAKDVPRER